MLVQASFKTTYMKSLIMIACTLLLTCATHMAQTQTTTDDQFSSANGKPVLSIVRERRFNEAPDDPVNVLKTARVICVMSHTILVGSDVVETKLQKRPEFKQLGMVLTRDMEAADLILEVRHDVFTKFTYTAVDPRTQTVVASGKLSSLGGTVGGKVAKRFMKQLVKAR